MLIDVSFISLREILPAIRRWADKSTVILAMAKPQFETTDVSLKHDGVIKNERARRQILASLEQYFRKDFVVDNKADSRIFGLKGNRERFYKLIPSRN